MKFIKLKNQTAESKFLKDFSNHIENPKTQCLVKGKKKKIFMGLIFFIFKIFFIWNKNYLELKEKLNVNQTNFNQEILQNDKLFNSLNIDSNSFFVVAKIMFSKTLEVFYLFFNS